MGGQQSKPTDSTVLKSSSFSESSNSTTKAVPLENCHPTDSMNSATEEWNYASATEDKPTNNITIPNETKKRNYTVISTPLDSSFFPTLGVTLWLGCTIGPILTFVFSILLPRSLVHVRTLIWGVLTASVFLPRSFPSPKIGTRIGDWIMKQAESYFGLTTTLEDEQALRDIGDQKYTVPQATTSSSDSSSSRSPPPCAIFAFEPHDLLPFPVFAFNPSLHRLPGRVGQTGSVLITSACFNVPFMRQVYTWVGCNAIDRKTFRKRLEQGKSLTLVPGGVQEVIYMMKDKLEKKKDSNDPNGLPKNNANGTLADEDEQEDIILYLKHRKGFVKMALEYGVPIVPVFAFHIENSFGYWIPPDGPWTRRIARAMGMLPVIYWGRWGIPFGIPSPKRVHVVIGSPIFVPWMGSAVDNANIDKYHAIYLKELEDLYERHKHGEGYGKRKLRIV